MVLAMRLRRHELKQLEIWVGGVWVEASWASESFELGLDG